MLDPRFEKFGNFIFDLDGTLWKWTRLIPGAKVILNELYKAEKNVFFVTNNTALSRAGFAAKLRGFGVKAKKEQVINPSLPACRLLKGKRVLVLAEGIRRDLKEAGIEVTASSPQAVLVGEDRTINYRKLTAAALAVGKGAQFFKTATGGAWLIGNQKWPGTGAIAAAIEMATGKVAELIGKPSRHMLQDMRKLKLKAEETLLIGDEIYSDIMAGNLLGWKTALVLTGNSTGQDALLAKGAQKPHFVFTSVSELLKM